MADDNAALSRRSLFALSVAGAMALPMGAQAEAAATVRDRIDDLNALIKDIMVKTGVPGIAVAVISSDEVIWV